MLENTKTAKRSKLWRNIKLHKELYFMLIPIAVWLAIFWLAPLYGIQIAFRDYKVSDGFWGSKWVGLDHFKRFIDSFYFGRVIKNTLAINLYGLLLFPLTLFLALIFNEMPSKKYKSVAQLISYAPNFLSVIVVCGMITSFFSSSGMVNAIVRAFGGETIDFLGGTKYFYHIYVWSGVWQGIGFGTILYTSAMSAIPDDLYEAAILDGAGRFQRMWHITLPGIKYVIAFSLIMSLGNMMSLGFEKIYLLQNNLNLEASEVVSTYVYKSGLIGGEFSYSTAIGLFNTVINLVLLIVANKISKKACGFGIW